MPVHFLTPAIFIAAFAGKQMSKQGIGDKKIIYICITSLKLIEGTAYFESKSSRQCFSAYLPSKVTGRTLHSHWEYENYEPGKKPESNRKNKAPSYAL